MNFLERKRPEEIKRGRYSLAIKKWDNKQSEPHQLTKFLTMILYIQEKKYKNFEQDNAYKSKVNLVKKQGHELVEHSLYVHVY